MPHFERRLGALDGKAMIVCMSRRICVELYKYLRELPGYPEVAVVMTGSASAAGMKKPDISILSDEFLAEVQGMEHKNLPAETMPTALPKYAPYSRSSTAYGVPAAELGRDEGARPADARS